jgi:hypothetical protein
MMKDTRPENRRAGGGLLQHAWFQVSMMMLVVHAFAGTVWAQRPSSPPKDEGGAITAAIAGGVIILVGVCGFLNPKRSHLT